MPSLTFITGKLMMLKLTVFQGPGTIFKANDNGGLATEMLLRQFVGDRAGD